MKEYKDPLDHLEPEKVDEQLEKALENPFSVNFRPKEKQEVAFHPDDSLIRKAKVDYANKNVEVVYNIQETGERYLVVMRYDNIAIVESRSLITGNKFSRRSTIYHVVTPENDLVYEGSGYTETLNQLPRQAAVKAPGLVEEGREKFEDSAFTVASELEPGTENNSNTSPVPPEPSDPLFDD